MTYLKSASRSVTDREKWGARRASFVAKVKATKAVWFPPRTAETGKKTSRAKKTITTARKKTTGAAQKRAGAAKKATGTG